MSPVGGSGNGSGPGVAAVRIGPAPVGRVMLAIASGLALSAAFPSLDLAPLAWVGLVPVLVAAHGLTPRRAFVVGWLAGFVFYLATVYWVAYTITRYTQLPLPIAIGLLVLMSAALAVYHGAFVAGVRWMDDRRLPTLWLAPPLWVALEWLRGWFFIGFPWALLGYSQYRAHDLVQMAEVTGVYGISAVLVFFNVVTAAVVITRGAHIRRLVPALVALSVLVTGLPLAGSRRATTIAALPPKGTLRVALVQGNIEQDQKWDPTYQGETIRRYRNLSHAAIEEDPALVVWPETATPFFFQEPGPLRDAVVDLARSTGVPLLFGSPAYRRRVGGGFEELNRVYLLAASGRELGTYDKMQLVPFGEYVPFARVLFFVEKLVPAGAIAPGDDATVLPLGDAHVGALVCYEGIFPALTRRFVAGGADFLVNVTNDAWYGRTSAPHQHLAQATLRAVENRVPVVRAANTGISAVIDPDGRIRWQGPLYEALWHVDRIAWPGVETFYTRFGNAFAWACALASLAAFGYGARRRDG